MEKVNILIIGAGVVGLTIAKTLSESFEDVVLVEKEETFGLHTSSRNSEVIHSGIYYPPQSYKAQLCVLGNQLLYNFALENNIPFKRCGKLVVATNESEYDYLKKLKSNGITNGVTGLEILDKQECNHLEPQIKAKQALYVPTTGIIDTYKLMYKMASIAEDNGAFIIYNMEVVRLEKLTNGYRVYFANDEVYEANTVINAAGLWSDKVAEMVGIDPDIYNLRLHWCKGEYYKTSRIKNIEHLIYPIPDPNGIFLGIHLTINLNGEIRFGPNAYYLDKLDYSMNDRYLSDFHKAISKYLNIDREDLRLDDCGIRPKLQKPFEYFRDFYIEEESEKGYPNFINIIGIESPGLTSCLAIATEIKKMCKCQVK